MIPALPAGYYPCPTCGFISVRDGITCPRCGLFDPPTFFREASKNLVTAARDSENHLDKAEFEFAEGAFAPFWDEIENATVSLAAYQSRIGSLAHFVVQCSVPFAVNLVPKIPDARPFAQRLSAVVRKAQKDFQFAMIYEQRKTNKILVAGFTTLGSAICNIGNAISSSLNELSEGLHDSLDELLYVVKDQGIAATARAEDRQEFERRVLNSQEKQEEMLDNIQRRRKPMP